MMFSKESGMQQVKELLSLYSELQLHSLDSNQIVLTGNILVNRNSKEFTLYKKYNISIVIPLLSDELPFVIDQGHQIDDCYQHRYSNGKLCLETDTCIRVNFIEGFSLSLWMKKYVEPYFFSYEYYNRYGEFPFGERGHGIEGIIQTYEDFFKENDIVKTLHIMRHISLYPYRGHLPCPCGSRKKLRDCHGRSIIKFYNDERLRRIVFNDYNLIVEVLKEYDKQQ